MNISKLASTVILTTSIATFFLFGFIFYLYGGDTKAIEKALSTTSGFFGGIATLVTAYIATQLFNDWRLEKNYELHEEKLQNFSENLFKIHKTCEEVISWFSYLHNEYYKESSDKSCILKKINSINYRNIQEIIRDTEFLIEYLSSFSKYNEIVVIYREYNEILSRLCFISEDAENIYQKFFENFENINISPFKAFHFQEHQDPSITSIYTSLMSILNRPIDINNQSYTYPEAYEQLSTKYDEQRKLINAALDPMTM